MTPRIMLAGSLAGSLAALLVAAGCSSRSDVTLRTDTRSSTTLSHAFAGSKACAECHRSEFDIQSHSHHALTMRHADTKSLGSLSPPTGPIANTAYTITEQSGDFTFTSSDLAIGSAAMEYALGSGIANVTYIGRIGADHLTEFRMSYNPGRKQWYITPGQETKADLGLGEDYQNQIAARCVTCHADTLQAGSDRPAEGSLGVGCESCHGPGAAHIATMRSNPRAPNLKIDNPGKQTPHQINSLCGTCHRNVEDIPLTGIDSVNTPRYQVYGLETSKCYRRSNNQISCITCHEPHADASTDLHHYEKVCLSCHSSKADKSTVICPVNQKENCIGCHMPKRQVMPFTKIPLQMTDHLIWAYRRDH